MAGATLGNGIANLIFLETDEQFDEYDVLGATTGDNEPLPPRVHIIDPFTSDYHQNVVLPNMIEPYTDYLAHMSSDPTILVASQYSNYPDLILPGQIGAADETLLEWKSGMTFTLNHTVMSGYKSSLSNAEFSAQFGMMNQIFGSGADMSGMQMYQQTVGMTNNTTSSTLLAFSYDTHFAIDDDAETIEDWAQYV